MAAGSKISLELEPGERRDIARKAKSLGMSVDDYVRAALQAFNPDPVAREELERALSRLDAATSRAEEALDKALAAIPPSQKPRKRKKTKKTKKPGKPRKRIPKRRRKARAPR